MKHYTVSFVLERAVISTSVSSDDMEEIYDEDIIALAEDVLTHYYKIDPNVLHLQEVIVEEDELWVTIR